MDPIRYRPADARDAEAVADLHADSWRRFYRGAYSDSFLDGDLVTDRRVAWSARLAAPDGTATVVAERDGHLDGFVHVVFDSDPTWGSLLYNLHVVHHRRGGGIGGGLLRHAARAVRERAPGGTMFLWVLEQNTAAQGFYRACGGVPVEREPVPPPGGDPSRLTGTPYCLRVVWSAGALLSLCATPRSPGASPPAGP